MVEGERAEVGMVVLPQVGAVGEVQAVQAWHSGLEVEMDV